MKRGLITLCLLLTCGLFLFDGGLEADMDQVTASLVVTITPYLSLELGVEDDWAVDPARATSIVLNEYDDVYPTDMFAPPRDELGDDGQNYSWHFANVVTSAASWSLEAALTTAPTGPGGTLDDVEVGFDGGYRSIPGQEQGELIIVGNEDDEDTPDENEYWENFPITRNGAVPGNVKCYYRYHLNAVNKVEGTYSGGVVTFTATTL